MEDLERALAGERQRCSELAESWQADIRQAQETERLNTTARHAVELENARMQAELHSAHDQLEAERGERRKVEESIAAIDRGRDALHDQFEAMRTKLEEAQRSLEPERLTTSRLEQVLGERLNGSTAPARPRKSAKRRGAGSETP